VRKILGIVVHCSDSPFGDVATIRAWHKSKGWSDIGYHHVILNGHRKAHSAYEADLDGVISIGRPVSRQGAHCPEANRSTLGVCLILKPPALPTERQEAALADYCMRMMRRYGFGPNAVKGHREYPSAKKQGKTCPGFDCKHLRAFLRE